MSNQFKSNHCFELIWFGKQKFKSNHKNITRAYKFYLIHKYRVLWNIVTKMCEDYPPLAFWLPIIQGPSNLHMFLLGMADELLRSHNLKFQILSIESRPPKRGTSKCDKNWGGKSKLVIFGNIILIATGEPNEWQKSNNYVEKKNILSFL